MDAIWVHTVYSNERWTMDHVMNRSRFAADTTLPIPRCRYRVVGAVR